MAESKQWVYLSIKNGYVLRRDYGILNCPYLMKDGRIYEHVYQIWINMIPYDPEVDVIHHLNANRADNRLENLRVLKRSEHPYYTDFHFTPKSKKKKIANYVPEVYYLNGENVQNQQVIINSV